MTRSISASEFKAKCLKLMDEVAETGDPLVVTKNGKPVVRIVPAEPKRRLLGRSVGKIRILGDIVGPVYEEWAKGVEVKQSNK